MTVEERSNTAKVDILGVDFDNTTMLQMVENIKTFLQINQRIIFYSNSQP